MIELGNELFHHRNVDPKDVITILDLWYKSTRESP